MFNDWRRFLPMTWNAPRLVTIDLSSMPFADAAIGAQPLCIEEMLSLINELADLGVPAVRFTIDATEASDGMLRAIEHARRRKLAPIVTLRGCSDGALIGPIVKAGAATIAVPLHSHVASIHQAVAEGHGDWSRSIGLAGLVRDAGGSLEIETCVTSANALPLLPLMEEIEVLGAAQWRLTFDGSNIGSALAITASTAVMHAAARDRLQIIVHDLPQLSAILAKPLGWFQPPVLTNLKIMNAGEAMRISYCGDVYFDQPGSGRAGSIRQALIDAIEPLLRDQSLLPGEMADHNAMAKRGVSSPFETKAFANRVTASQSV
jgi:hypothetical protein